MAGHNKRFFIKFSRFVAMKCSQTLCVSLLTAFDWNLLFNTIQVFVVLLHFNKMCSYLVFFFWYLFFPFFLLWAPKGVTYRAFAGGCYKWKFSNHSISFVTWAKWCVHGSEYLMKHVWNLSGRKLPLWFALISINIHHLLSVWI